MKNRTQKRTERRLLFWKHGTESVDTWRWRVVSRTYDL